MEETSDRMDKHRRAMVKALGHLMGLRETRDGKLVATEDEEQKAEVNIENIGVNAGMSWEAGAMLSSVADMGLLSGEKVQGISAKISEFASSSKPSDPPPPPVVEPEKKKSAKVPDFEDMSKGPAGFYPPRKVPTTTTAAPSVSSTSKPTEDLGQRETLFQAPPPRNFAKPVVQEPPPQVIKRAAVGFGARPAAPPKEDPPQQDDKPGMFRTAYQQLLIDDKRKGVQRSVAPAVGGPARVSGLTRLPQRSAPAPLPPSDDQPKVSDNPEVEELMQHESMKNIDAKMVEAILNEIMDTSTTDWDDIAGLGHVKKTIREIIIWPMERPDIFTGLRAAPRGILFFGPPGTGKTMFGKVIATQSRSTFFNISASSLTSKWIGDGEKMVRALFAVARVKQPSVIFIDEIDSILTQRSDTEHESSRRMKTEFLIQFDGCATTTADRILVIGVTNRPQELDEAARRRLVKRIYIPLPDFEARRQLVKNLIKEYSSDLTEVDFDKIAKITEGYSGADMNSLCREAAYGPLREVGDRIQSLDVDQVRPMRMRDFVQALRHVKSSVAMSDVKLYEDWDAKFGCHVGPAPDMDSSQLSQFSQVSP